MAQNFLFYASFIEAVESLPKRNQLEVLKAIIRYGCYNEMPKEDGIAKAIVGLVAPNIDSAKKRHSASVKNGKAGGRPANDNLPKPSDNAPRHNNNLPKPNNNQIEPSNNLSKPNDNLAEPNSNLPKPSDNLEREKEIEVEVESDVDTEKERESALALATAPTIKNYKKPTKREVLAVTEFVLEDLNARTGESFSATNEETQKSVARLLKQGFSVEQMLEVVEKKEIEWRDVEHMRPHLHPKTLFGRNFASYLEQPGVSEVGGVARRNKFANFPPRERDYDEMERIEHERIAKEVGLWDGKWESS
ncbi:MAG: conserved phage C-terminal domain-containing protein [Turicibacter sp.]|nr:conserved phage C-terminal domain-containing protein [Turicibacter sp.]